MAAHGMLSSWACHSHRPLAEALFEGRQGGAIFVDDAAQPHTALICPKSGFHFACGDVRADLVAETLSEMRDSLDPKAELYATSTAWREGLAKYFDRPICRLGYEHDGRAREASAPPEGFELAPITPAMASTWNPAADRSGLDPWIFDIWDGPEGFAERSFGFAVLSAGRPIAFTAACAIGGGEAEVEVGTARAWRQRGLATVTCLAFMAECRARGLTPTWTTSSDNSASIALAKRLGYTATEEVWGFRLE